MESGAHPYPNMFCEFLALARPKTLFALRFLMDINMDRNGAWVALLLGMLTLLATMQVIGNFV